MSTIKKLFLIIAIDGEAGTGKSTAAKAIAQALGITYLNTGLIYRALAYLALQGKKGDIYNEVKVAQLANKAMFVFEDGEVVAINEHNVAGKLKTEEIDKIVPIISAMPGVRKALIDVQRKFAEKHHVVIEGRDIGTVILPNATLKYFFTCNVEKRAERLALEGKETTASQLSERDRLDAGNTLRAEDAKLIDTTRLTRAKVRNLIVREARREATKRGIQLPRAA